MIGDFAFDSVIFAGAVADGGVSGGLIHIKKNCAIGVTGGRIAWLGGRADFPAARLPHPHKVIDVPDLLITPGLIDCHTHLVFAGDRSGEFEQRLNGVSYEEIARRGGGILSTVSATRAASFDELISMALPRVEALLAEGVTTIEIKSGYGLDLVTERKCLQVARGLARRLPITIRNTYLGLHAIPPEFKDRPSDYVAWVCAEILPELAADGLIDAVDAYCEKIAFSAADVAKVFDASNKLGLPVKLHADQLTNSGGAALLAQYSGLSADHLIYADEQGIEKMASSGAVAVLLPGACYFLRESHLPPIDLLRRHGVPIAIATDANPGSSPIFSLLTVMHMASSIMRLTPAEVFQAVTVNAARALGLSQSHGRIEIGKRADLAFWRMASPRDLVYTLGLPRCELVMSSGAIAYVRAADSGLKAQEVS